MSSSLKHDSWDRYFAQGLLFCSLIHALQTDESEIGDIENDFKSDNRDIKCMMITAFDEKKYVDRIIGAVTFEVGVTPETVDGIFIRNLFTNDIPQYSRLDFGGTLEPSNRK